MTEPAMLEFLIPSYKRPGSVLTAVTSVATQVQQLGLENQVKIRITDDCSPNIAPETMQQAITPYAAFTSFSKNSANKGMSRNIRDMVADSSAEFCTVLTDDDSLRPDTLAEIMAVLEKTLNDPNQADIAAIYTPRYSYLEDMTLHTIVCQPFTSDTRISAGAVNSLRFLLDGFVLTGLFFKPHLINFDLWNANIENGYFPVIYFSDLLRHHDSLYLYRNWFFHIVENECHWEAWGSDERARKSRLFTDYMKAVTVSAHEAFASRGEDERKLRLFFEEFKLYRDQLRYVYSSKLDLRNARVDAMTESRYAYKLALLNYRLYEPFRYRLRHALGKLKYKLVSTLQTSSAQS